VQKKFSPSVGLQNVIRLSLIFLLLLTGFTNAHPVLFLYGEKTRKPYKRICEILADKIPGSQITCIKGASHNSPLTHAEIVNSTIRKFLNA
jgi:pimeloyl-ACP methyl ester carboxylesterase